MPAPSFANHPAALGGVSNGFLPEALESEVRRIYARSPLYGLRHPLEAGRLHWAQYEALPVLSKREIVERGHRVFSPTTARSSAGCRRNATSTSRPLAQRRGR